MRRIIFWTGTLTLGLAALVWATAPIGAYQGGRGGGGGGGGARGGGGGAHVGGGRVGGGQAVARVGSIHFGERAGRDPVGPAVQRGRELGGAARNPYHSDYARHFRPGYRSIMLGGAQYYLYDTLPDGCQTVLANGITYDVCDGVYYQPYIYGGQTVYLVVPT
jgi:hypothetical protein